MLDFGAMLDFWDHAGPLDYAGLGDRDALGIMLDLGTVMVL